MTRVEPDRAGVEDAVGGGAEGGQHPGAAVVGARAAEPDDDRAWPRRRPRRGSARRPRWSTPNSAPPSIRCSPTTCARLDVGDVPDAQHRRPAPARRAGPRRSPPAARRRARRAARRRSPARRRPSARGRARRRARAVRQPAAMASAASTAVRVPANLSGAMSTRMSPSLQSTSGAHARRACWSHVIVVEPRPHRRGSHRAGVHHRGLRRLHRPDGRVVGPDAEPGPAHLHRHRDRPERRRSRWCTATRSTPGVASSKWDPIGRYSQEFWLGHAAEEPDRLDVQLHRRRTAARSCGSSTAAGPRAARRSARSTRTGATSSTRYAAHVS